VTAMKAVRIHAYGGTDVLAYEDAPRPTLGDSEVLIRVHATTVNPFDCAVRAGYMSAYINYTFPLILGTDVSGVVEDVGAGVASFAPGDNVYARAGVTRDARTPNMLWCRFLMSLPNLSHLTTFMQRPSLM